jgi:hypothetical protein
VDGIGEGSSSLHTEGQKCPGAGGQHGRGVRKNTRRGVSMRIDRSKLVSANSLTIRGRWTSANWKAGKTETHAMAITAVGT